MKAKSFLPTTIVISALLAQLTFAALPRYEVIDLGTLGGIRSTGWSINDKGQVVGYAENSLGKDRATLFDTTGSGNNIDLGTLDGQSSQAYSINRSGQIVGQATNASGKTRATLFHPTGEGNNIDLGTLGGDRSNASSINDSGQIVGWAQITSGERHATLFDPTGSHDNIDLGTLGGDESWASSINNSCQIVGTAYRLFTSPGGRFPPVTSSHLRATWFDPTGQGNNIDLGTLLYTYGVCCCSGAMSINDSGHIVGAAWNEEPFPFGQGLAVLFDPTVGENNIFLGTMDRYGSFAYSINNRDQIIGWGGFCSNNLCGTRPALFDHTGQGNNVNLYDLIDPCCGWILKEVWSINDSGWIVGEGINPAGKHHAFLMKPVPPKVIYVDDDAAGANDGSSWDDAFNYLQDALAAAWDGDEIRVAQGTYKPDQGVVVIPGDREATFQLINGVTIKGGYAGAGTPDPNARDIKLYETILSGDLDSNDIEVNDPFDLRYEPTRGENSYNVVTGSQTNRTAVLDGFTIIGGNANGPRQNDQDDGGGMYNDSGSPTIRNCIFSRNSAKRIGGGMFNRYGNPKVFNCTITWNSGFTGGGMYNAHSSPMLTHCIFSRNSAHLGGGGGMYNYWDSSPTLTNCNFIRNWTSDEGGGMFNSRDSYPTLINCTFSGNWARWSGGGMFNRDSYPTLTNCIFWGDISGEIYTEDSDVSPVITYSNVQGGWPGEGNIDADPCFVNADGGNYHLLPDSPCIDAGDPNYIAGPNETDLDGRPRIIGGRIDMGAYEVPIPAEARILPRTINLTSKGNWITCYIWLSGDYDVADIEPGSVMLERQIEAEQFSVDEHKQVATATFDREDVQSILEVGDIKLTIACQLTDGTYFEATDIIQVTDKGVGQSAK